MSKAEIQTKPTVLNDQPLTAAADILREQGISRPPRSELKERLLDQLVALLKGFATKGASLELDPGQLKPVRELFNELHSKGEWRAAGVRPAGLVLNDPFSELKSARRAEKRPDPRQLLQKSRREMKSTPEVAKYSEGDALPIGKFLVDNERYLVFKTAESFAEWSKRSTDLLQLSKGHLFNSSLELIETLKSVAATSWLRASVNIKGVGNLAEFKETTAVQITTAYQRVIGQELYLGRDQGVIELLGEIDKLAKVWAELRIADTPPVKFVLLRDAVTFLGRAQVAQKVDLDAFYFDRVTEFAKRALEQDQQIRSAPRLVAANGAPEFVKLNRSLAVSNFFDQAISLMPAVATFLSREGVKAVGDLAPELIDFLTAIIELRHHGDWSAALMGGRILAGDPPEGLIPYSATGAARDPEKERQYYLEQFSRNDETIRMNLNILGIMHYAGTDRAEQFPAEWQEFRHSLKQLVAKVPIIMAECYHNVLTASLVRGEDSFDPANFEMMTRDLQGLKSVELTLGSIEITKIAERFLKSVEHDVYLARAVVYAELGSPEHRPYLAEGLRDYVKALEEGSDLRSPLRAWGLRQLARILEEEVAPALKRAIARLESREGSIAEQVDALLEVDALTRAQSIRIASGEVTLRPMVENAQLVSSLRLVQQQYQADLSAMQECLQDTDDLKAQGEGLTRYLTYAEGGLREFAQYRELKSGIAPELITFGRVVAGNFESLVREGYLALGRELESVKSLVDQLSSEISGLARLAQGSRKGELNLKQMKEQVGAAAKALDTVDGYLSFLEDSAHGGLREAKAVRTWWKGAKIQIEQSIKRAQAARLLDQQQPADEAVHS